jgi:transposase
MSNFKRPYPAEFREEAVRLLRSKEDGRSVAELARDLGVTAETLRNWAKQDRVDQGEQAGLTSLEREELKALRRENRQLRQDREILKKAAAFFAKETDDSRR